MQPAQLAQQAWDSTKQKEDPAFADERMQNDFRGKLVTVAKEVLEHGSLGGVAGLEAYDAKCLELAQAAKEPKELKKTDAKVDTKAEARAEAKDAKEKK